MKTKSLITGLILFSFALLPAAAGALTYVDSISFIDDQNPMGHLVEAPAPAWGPHNVLSFSFYHPENFPTEEFPQDVLDGLVSATITITVLDLADTGGDPEEIRLSYSLASQDFFVPEGEAGSLFLDVSAAVSSISTEGGFGVTVAALLGEFYVQSSTMELEYDRDTAPVPEPGTMLLMGSGLIGVAFAIRKKLPSIKAV